MSRGLFGDHCSVRFEKLLTAVCAEYAEKKQRMPSHTGTAYALFANSAGFCGLRFPHVARTLRRPLRLKIEKPLTAEYAETKQPICLPELELLTFFSANSAASAA